MRYAQIRDMDISNGNGIACSIFLQGCTHHCKGCFQPETWEFSGGKELTEDTIDRFIELCKAPYIKCVSILGGEPFDQNCYELYDFLNRIKTETGKTIYVWTGYTYEYLFKQPVYSDCLKEFIDILIDGEFELKKRNLNLKLRGSENQRVVDVKKSIACGFIQQII